MFGSGKDKPSPLAAPAASAAAGKQIDTLIAQQCSLEGDLTTQNSIKVDGQIKGTLRAEGRAIIGETGVVKGDVHAADLLVLGRLEGNVYAQRLHLQASANIHGNITTDSLQVDPGARYHGSVSMQGDAASGTPTVVPFAAPGVSADAATPRSAKG